MCRLFGMSGGEHRVHATFWLLEAPDSLAEQSRREPDGTGLGWFDDDGRARVAKQPLAAYEDVLFAREARERESRVFVAHIRYATTGEVEARNTHPFEQHGRAGTVRVRSERLARSPAVIVASERMDEDPGWRLLAPGELIHVGRPLGVESTIVIERPPARPLTLDDLQPRAAAAQAPPPHH
jgi:predicted glutamine amidotransferase